MTQADLHLLRASVLQFVDLAGTAPWKKRITHLRQELDASPFRAKVVVDYNWLELVLGDHLDVVSGGSSGEPLAPEDLTALYFAQAVVHAHSRLTPRGQQQLQGRLRDSLQSQTGFSSLFLEIDVARRLLDAGYEVQFADMDGAARYDLRFWNGATEGEVECKTLSTDAGRKIHRHDFHRFVDAVSPALNVRLEARVREAIVVTLDSRLPGDDTAQNELRTAVRRVLLDPDTPAVRGSFFSIGREACALGNDEVWLSATQQELYSKCREAYGENCHVSGGFSADGCCLLVVRSQREDDHSGPELEALKKAASQFSGTRPAFIAVQYDDISVADLALPHLRRRAGILSYALFSKDDASHVTATYFCAYHGMVVGQTGIGVPAFAVRNPQARFKLRASDYAPFLAHIPDDEFATTTRGSD